MFPRYERLCVVEGDVVVLIRRACLTAEVELHVSAHCLVVAAVPRERPVTFHRRGCPVAIRFEERFGHVVEVAHGTLSPLCQKSAEYRREEGSAESARTRLGGRIPLPRTGGAPTRTHQMVARAAARVKRLQDT